MHDAGMTRTAVVAAQLQGICDDEDRMPRRPLQWLVLMLLAAVVGAMVGLVGTAFRLSLLKLDLLRGWMIAWAHGQGGWWTVIIPVLLCAAGAAAATYLTQRLAPQSAGSGIPRVEGVLRNHLHPVGFFLLPVKFLGGALAIGSGLALGREGPTVQMGGIIGRHLSDSLKRFLPEPWTLIAAGAGAGLAVAFNAPLAAVLFVMEELLHRFSARIFSATLVASITGTVVLRAIIGNVTDLAVPQLTELPSQVLLSYVLLGALAGLFGLAINLSLLKVLQWFDHAANWPRGAKGALIGAAAGLLAWFAPALVGDGESIAQSVIVTVFPYRTLCIMLALRILLTFASFGSGAPGGIFSPLLALGALLGSGFAAVETAVLHQPHDPMPYAIVAMAACFAAVRRSALTGVVLLLEMTGSWPLILPMLAASVTAYSIPEIFGNPPLYDSIRERDETIERAKMRLSEAAGS